MEFVKTHTYGTTKCYRRPYGKAVDKSYRMRGFRKVETQCRRTRQKEYFRKLLNDLDNDLV